MTAIFLKSRGAAAQIWAYTWASEGANRVVIHSAHIAIGINTRFTEECRSLAAAAALNILTNSAKKGRDVIVVEDIPLVERRLRFFAKKLNYQILEKDL